MSRATTTTTRGFILAHQRIDLELSFLHSSAAGFTELQIIPNDDQLRSIHLHARQLNITHISVQGINAEYTYRDLLKDVTLSDPTDVHRYPELKRKLYVAASEGNGGELSILLPPGARPEPLTSQSASAVEYAPITIRIHYTLSNITEALRFVKAGDAAGASSATHSLRSAAQSRPSSTHIYTEPTCGDWARCWVPCVDSLWERCTWELSFTVPTNISSSGSPSSTAAIDPRNRAIPSQSTGPPVTVVCTGDLVEEAVHPSNSSKTRFTFAQSVPTSVQHLAFAAGPFSKHVLPTTSISASSAASGAAPLTASNRVEEGGDGANASSAAPQLDIVAYCLPGAESDMINSVSFARQALDFFARDFGSYPFGSYKLVFVQGTLRDVHAASSLSIFSDALLHSARIIDQAYETRHIIANSIATQWVGINIIPKWYADCWLTSSLASYITALFLRRLLGNNEYRFRLKKDCDQCAMWDIGMPPLYQPGLTEPPDEQYQPFLNLKGPLVLYLLDRRLCKVGASLGLGRVIPKIFLQALTGELINGAISTSAFLRTCRKVSGADLRTFGEQWIYGSGCPRFALTASLNRKRLVIEMQIRQDAPAYTYAQTRPDDSAYSNPVQMFEGQFTVRVHEADGTPYEHVLDLKQEVTKFDVPFNTKGRRTRRKTTLAKRAGGDGTAGGEGTKGGGTKAAKAAAAAAAAAKDDAASNDASDGPVDLGFGVYAPWEDERERRRWKVADWTDEDDTAQANNAAYEWIRLDADFEWICQVHFDQSDYMWHSQLERDRDVVAQVTAIAALSHMPSPITATVLTRTVLVDKYFYRVRMEAAHALVSCAVPQLQYLGLFLLFQLYRTKYCYDQQQDASPRNQDLAVPSISKSNDFSDFANYFLQRAVVNAISRVRNPYGRTLPQVKLFLINLLRYNDNSMNRYSDDHFVAGVVNALANSFVPVESPIHRRFIKAEEDPDAAGDESLLKEALDEVERLRELDVFIPSYHSVITIAALDWFSSMMMANIIPVDLQLFLNYTGQNQATPVREVAFASLLLMKGLHHKIVTPYLLAVLREDPSRHLRRSLARGICESLAVELACGEFGDSTECPPQMPAVEEGDAEEREMIKQAAELAAEKEYKAQTDSNFRTLRREIGRSAAVRDGFLGALLAPVPDTEVRWALIKVAEMLFKPAEEKDLPFQPKVSVRVKLPTFAQPLDVSPSKEKVPFIEVPDLPNRESFEKADIAPRKHSIIRMLLIEVRHAYLFPLDSTTSARQIKLTLAPRKSSDAANGVLQNGSGAESASTGKKLKLKRPKPLAPEQASGMEKADLTACRNCLKKLRESKHAALFLHPVDPVRDRAPNYFSVIKRPMDLSTMANKLDAGLYKDRFEFKADFELIVSNALTYTPNDKMLVHQEALKFDKMFKAQWNRITNTLEQAKAKQRIQIDLTGGSSDTSIGNTSAAANTVASTVKASGSSLGPIVIADDDDDDPIALSSGRPGGVEAPTSAATPKKIAKLKLKVHRGDQSSTSSPAPYHIATGPRPETGTAQAPLVINSSSDDPLSNNMVKTSSAPSGPVKSGIKIKLKPRMSSATGSPSPAIASTPPPPPRAGPSSKQGASGASPITAATPAESFYPFENADIPSPVKQPKIIRPKAPIHPIAKAAVEDPVGTAVGVPMHIKRCKAILQILKKLPEAVFFLRPVDPIADGVPTYLEEIQNPMDLGTMEKKLEADSYGSMDEFASDMELIWANCRLFNPPFSLPRQHADQMEVTWRHEWGKALIPRLEFYEKRAMQSMLNRLKGAPVAVLFAYPVDPIKLNIPTYFTIVRKEDARDLSTILANLQADKYGSVAQIEADIQLMLANCYKFNAGNEAVVAQAKAFEAFYKKELNQAKASIAKQAPGGSASGGSGSKRKAGASSSQGSSKKRKLDDEDEDDGDEDDDDDLALGSLSFVCPASASLSSCAPVLRKQSPTKNQQIRPDKMQSSQILRSAAVVKAAGSSAALSARRSAALPSASLSSTSSSAQASLAASASSSHATRAPTQLLRRPKPVTATALLSKSYASSATPSAPIPSSALVEISRLPNNITVATESTPGHFSALGIYVDVGSRYERQHVPGESGISHLLDRMAFKSTTTRTAEDMTAEISRLGGNFFCSSSRETMMYQASIFNQDLHSALDLLADTVLNPKLSKQELDMQKEAAEYEIREIAAKPEMMLPEILHHVAYEGNTLGFPLLCPPESLPVMTADNLRDFVNAWYTPDRIVVAGAGMAHQELVEAAQKRFGHLKARDAFPDGSLHISNGPTSSNASRLSTASLSNGARSGSASPSLGSADFSTSSLQAAQHASTSELSFAAQAKAPARYTGGEYYISSPELDFTHIYVAFEGLSVHDEDIYALATLQILLGGGGSFSAGGPGKGMYSRLYSHVLNRFHKVDFCSSFHHCYNDSGLFGIAISVQPDFVSQVPAILAMEFESLMEHNHRNAVTQTELNRARNQLKSSLVMALESRLVEVEDLGRQVQVHGKKVSVEEMCAKIDQVDLSRLRRVATRVLRPTITAESRGTGIPTVVAQGSLDGLGDVRALLASRGLGVPPPGYSNAPHVTHNNSTASSSSNGLFRKISSFGSRSLHTSAVMRQDRPPSSRDEFKDAPAFFQPRTRAERRTQQGPPSRHALFYRDIVPPLLRVLAYGSIVYLGLHLTWVVLDREEQDTRHTAEITILQDEIKKLRRSVVTEAQEGLEQVPEAPRSWWSSLLGR
ncbi:hypothetical protein OC861_005196 [Tilletia horrida]|nr:hypothetical protein OC845_005016 [Tilletia horrida]KAK0562672.1 hypothetical protein OC861_005196 [Tilletia horrida]